MKIITTVYDGDREYKVESSDFDTHYDKLAGAERMIERLSKFPTCVWCGDRYDIGEDKDCCSLACAEYKNQDRMENVEPKELINN